MPGKHLGRGVGHRQQDAIAAGKSAAAVERGHHLAVVGRDANLWMLGRQQHEMIDVKTIFRSTTRRAMKSTT